jgi:hypothetical protein
MQSIIHYFAAIWEFPGNMHPSRSTSIKFRVWKTLEGAIDCHKAMAKALSQDRLKPAQCISGGWVSTS